MKAIELLKECRLNLLNREHHERLLNDDDWQLIRKLDEFIADFRVDVPPVEQSDTVENVNNSRMLAGWGRYNYFWCADKGSHDMRLAFIAGYKRALYWATLPERSEICEVCGENIGPICMRIVWWDEKVKQHQRHAIDCLAKPENVLAGLPVGRQMRPLCDYTNRPALDSSQICRCGTCQLFARIILAED